MLTLEEKKLCEELKNTILKLEDAKLLYKEKDRLESMIEHISSTDLANEGILRTDNFAKKNTQWKNTAFTRWAYSLLELE